MSVCVFVCDIHMYVCSSSRTERLFLGYNIYQWVAVLFCSEKGICLRNRDKFNSAFEPSVYIRRCFWKGFLNSFSYCG